jgi:hypothetical protein
MKQVGMILLLIIVVLVPIMAETVEEDTELFLNELALQLQHRGWEQDEVALFREQARLMNLENMRHVDPALVAYALHYGAYDEADRTRETATVRAQLALAVAVESRELERLGYGSQAIALGASRGIREVLAQTRNQMQQVSGSSDNLALGEMIRNTVRAQVAEQQKAATRLSQGVANGSGRQFGQNGAASGMRLGSPGGFSR